MSLSANIRCLVLLMLLRSANSGISAYSRMFLDSVSITLFFVITGFYSFFYRFRIAKIRIGKDTLFSQKEKKQSSKWKYGASLPLPPEAGRDVHRLPSLVAVQPLVGAARFQPAALRTIRAGFYIVESRERVRQLRLPGIPRHLQRSLPPDIRRQPRHLLRGRIATHKTETGDLMAVFG